MECVQTKLVACPLNHHSNAGSCREPAFFVLPSGPSQKATFSPILVELGFEIAGMSVRTMLSMRDPA